MTQKTLRAFTAILITGVLVAGTLGCGAPADTPDAVALQFMEHVVRMEYQEASELGTESTQQLLSFLVMMTSGMSPEDLQDEVGTPDEITVVSSRVDGDSAVVVLSAGGEEESIDLRRVDGSWKVDLDKESMEKEF